MKRWLIALLAMALAAAPWALAQAEGAGEADGLPRMLPVFDSLLRTVGEDASSYDPENAEFVWGALYRMGVNFGLDDPDTAIDEQTFDMLVPGALMRSFAASAFPTLTALPDPLFGASYDGAADIYRLPGSDMSEAQARIDGYVEQGGRLAVTVSMAGLDGSVLDSMVFTVSPAPDGALFPYAVDGAE